MSSKSIADADKAAAALVRILWQRYGETAAFVRTNKNDLSHLSLICRDVDHVSVGVAMQRAGGMLLDDAKPRQ